MPNSSGRHHLRRPGATRATHPFGVVRRTAAEGVSLMILPSTEVFARFVVDHHLGVWLVGGGVLLLSAGVATLMVSVFDERPWVVGRKRRARAGRHVESPQLRVRVPVDLTAA